MWFSGHTLKVTEANSVPIYSSIAQSVEHAAVNRAVVGSSPTRGAWVLKGQRVRKLIAHHTQNGSLVKWLRHRPFTAVTWVQIP